MDKRKHYIPVEKYRIDNLYENQTEDKLSIDRLTKELKIKITTLNNKDITFEMIGIDVLFPHSIKQAAWGEIPTMALDLIDVLKNSTPVPEETLMEQMSYVAFNLDPKCFNFKKDDEEPSSENAVMFEFSAKNTSSLSANVFASQFKWVPIGSQRFPDNRTPKPIDADQLLMILEPKQEISFRAYCFKGKGIDHAKFSPSPYVNCVMAPVTHLKKQFTGEEAHKIKELLSPGVIKIKTKHGVEVAKVTEFNNYDLNRNIFMNEKFHDHVELFLNRRHFLINFEGTGSLHPTDIVTEAINVLKHKCEELIAALDGL